MRTLTILILSLVFISCKDYINNPIGDKPNDDKPVAREFTVLENSQLSGYEEKDFFVVNSEETYNEYYKRHLSFIIEPTLMIPQVDFNRHSVIFLFYGKNNSMVPKPEIKSVEFGEDKIYVTQKRPITDVTLPAISHPAVIIKVDKTHLSKIEVTNI